MITDITVARQILQERWPELKPSIMVNWHEDYDYPFWMLRLYKAQSATCGMCNHYEPKTDIVTSVQTSTLSRGWRSSTLEPPPPAILPISGRRYEKAT